MRNMFNSASSFKQQLCWDVTGKDVTNMFLSITGSSVISCDPSSSPTNQPTSQPSIQPPPPPVISESTSNVVVGAWVGGHLAVFTCVVLNLMRN